MNRITFQVGTFAVNCSIISESDKAIVVDPGAEATRIRAELKKQGLGLAAVLLTHAHFDHISAIPELQRAYPDLPVFISDADAKIVSHPFNQFPPDYPLVAELKNVKSAKSRRRSSPATRSSADPSDAPTSRAATWRRFRNLSKS